MKAKRSNTLDNLRSAAEKEMFQFELNEHSYTIQQLIDLGVESRIPNLVKLNKKCAGVKILNLCGSPVLHYTLK